MVNTPTEVYNHYEISLTKGRKFDIYTNMNAQTMNNCLVNWEARLERWIPEGKQEKASASDFKRALLAYINSKSHYGFRAFGNKQQAVKALGNVEEKGDARYNIDLSMIEELKKAYQKALDRGEDSFMFPAIDEEGNPAGEREILTSFAKYLIEYADLIIEGNQ